MQNILNYLNENPVVKSVITFLLQAAAVILITIVILWLSRKLFRNIQAHSKKLNTQFTEKVFRFLVIFISVMWLVMSNDLTRSFGQSLFQSTAVIAAIAGFAAQSVLSDMICGFIIHSTKPFGIGDRIELENGVSGIVKDMTLRHVVLKGIDTQMYIVPNSKVNAQFLKNMSFQSKFRSVDFHFSVSFDADPEQARQVIRQAVMDSPYSVPGRKAAGREAEYAEVYFMAFKDSCLDLETTGYYAPETPTEIFRNDINTRVKKALEDNGIEIPYGYLNVMLSRREKQPEI